MKIFLGTLILFIVLFFVNGVPYIQSDGFGCYHTTKSFISGLNFYTESKPDYFDYREHTIQDYEGKYVSVCPVGASVFNLPGLFVADLLDGNGTTHDEYFRAYAGNSLWEGVSVIITAMVLGYVSIILLFNFLRNISFSTREALVASFSSFFSSYALWYIFLNSFFSHIYELFSISLSLYLYSFIYIKQSKVKNSKVTNFYKLLLGLSLGLVVLCRPTLGIFSLGMFFLSVFQELQGSRGFNTFSLSVKNFALKTSTLTLGVFLTALLFFVYNDSIFGKQVLSSYSEIRGESFEFDQFHFFKLLLSPQRGWFVYTPIAILGLVGLALGLRRTSKSNVTGLILVALSTIFSVILTYSFWHSWWGGGSFGQRFFISLVPFVAFGVALLLHRFKMYKKYIYSLVLIFLIWSFCLTLLYRITPVGTLRPATDTIGEWNYQERYTPIDMFEYHYKLITNSDGLKGYASSLVKGVNGGNSFPTIFLGLNDFVLRLSYDDTSQLSLIFLEPPISRQAKPTFVTGFVNYESRWYEFAMELEPQEKNVIYCDGECYLNDMNLEYVDLEYAYFPRSELSGFNYGDMKIIFGNEENLQVKGNPIDLSPTDEGYGIE